MDLKWPPHDGDWNCSNWKTLTSRSALSSESIDWEHIASLGLDALEPVC
jgi:hypothetical protein